MRAGIRRTALARLGSDSAACVQISLALRLLEGDFGDGDTIKVDAVDCDIVFEHAGNRAVTRV